MKPITYRDLLIHLYPSEEPAGGWWPRATIEDPSTGETSPVSVPRHE
jgi:hypothetical protein